MKHNWPESRISAHVPSLRHVAQPESRTDRQDPRVSYSARHRILADAPGPLDSVTRAHKINRALAITRGPRISRTTSSLPISPTSRTWQSATTADPKILASADPACHARVLKYQR